MRCMRALGLFSGLEDNAYRPDETLTRAEAATMLAIMWEVSGRACQYGTSTTYADVPEDSPLAGFLECLHDAGVVQEAPGTDFSPDDLLSRSDLLLWLHRLFQAWRGDSGHVSGGFIQIERVCRQSGTELQRALGCFVEIDLIDVFALDLDVAQWAEKQTVTRAEAAEHAVKLTYVMTFLSNAIDIDINYQRGLDPWSLSPYSDPYGRSNPVGWELDPRVSIPVFYCGPPGVYSSADLAPLVDALNGYTDEDFHKPSAGLLEVTYTQGGIIEPDQPWSSIWPDWLTEGNSPGFIIPECFNPAHDEAGTSQVVILAHVGRELKGNDVAGRGRLFDGPAVTYLFQYPDGSPANDFEQLIRTTRHEVDHSLLGNLHVHDIIGFASFGTRISCKKTPDITIGGTISGLAVPGIGIFGDGCALFGDTSALQPDELDTVLTCADQERLGWPVGDDHAPCARFAPLIPPLESLTFDGSGSLVVIPNPPAWHERESSPVYHAFLHHWSSSERRWRLQDHQSRLELGQPITFSGLQEGEVYEFVLVGESEYGLGPDIGYRFIAMATPDDIQLSDNSRYPLEDLNDLSFELTFPKVPNATRYEYEILGSDYRWGGSAGGARHVEPSSGNVVNIRLGGSDLRWLGHTYEIRIYACAPLEVWGGGAFSTSATAEECFPYARYTLAVPPVGPRARPLDGIDDQACQMEVDDRPTAPAIRVSTSTTGAVLEWDPDPCVNWIDLSDPQNPEQYFGTIASKLRFDLGHVSSLAPGTTYETSVRACRVELNEHGIPEGYGPDDCSTPVLVTFTTLS